MSSVFPDDVLGNHIHRLTTSQKLRFSLTMLIIHEDAAVLGLI